MWTGTLSVRNKGTLKLNYQKSGLMKALDAVMDPLLSEKTKARRKVYGADWADDVLFEKRNLPRCYGGEVEDGDCLRWAEEYFE